VNRPKNGVQNGVKELKIIRFHGWHLSSSCHYQHNNFTNASQAKGPAFCSLKNSP